MTSTRNEELRASLALSDAEIASLVVRCPEPQQKAFEGWLRGTHELNGDLMDLDQDDGEQVDRSGGHDPE